MARSHIWLGIIVLTVFLTGLIVIFSTTSAEILDHELEKNTHHALVKQLCFFGFGCFLAITSYRIGYTKILKSSPLLFWMFVFFLLLTLIPGIGREVNGSRRWLGAGGVYFQPSEFVKFIVPTYFIYHVKKKPEIKHNVTSFLKIFCICLIPICLITIEPNNGTAAVVFLSLIILCFIMRISAKFWAFPLVVLTILGCTFAFQMPYVAARFNVYMHPELDILGRGHQPYQAKIAAGSGGAFGKGPGMSLQKLSYLPEAQNDYIGAIFAEEYGFVGIFSLVVIYSLIAYIGFSIASNSLEVGSFSIASVVTFLISFQAFLNLGVVSGLLPSTGLNLPFFSQGGTSLIANLSALGVLCSIKGSPLKEIQTET